MNCETPQVQNPRAVREARLVDAWNHCARVEAAERESLRSFKWNSAFSENSGSAP
jgi:hypothetical protein